MTRWTTTLSGIAAGAAGAIALMLACGDDTTGPDAARADAAACDCPDPLQPIDERLRLVTRTFAFPDEDTSLTVGLDCLAEVSVGSQLMSGDCLASGIGVGGGFVLTSSGRSGGFAARHECTWHKDAGGGANLTVQVDILCLVPEGTPLPDAGP